MAFPLGRKNGAVKIRGRPIVEILLGGSINTLGDYKRRTTHYAASISAAAIINQMKTLPRQGGVSNLLSTASVTNNVRVLEIKHSLKDMKSARVATPFVEEGDR